MMRVTVPRWQTDRLLRLPWEDVQAPARHPHRTRLSYLSVSMSLCGFLSSFGEGEPRPGREAWLCSSFPRLLHVFIFKMRLTYFNVPW